MPEGALGRLEPTDFRHVELWPLARQAAEDVPRRVPVVMGTNWWTAFDRPTKRDDGRYWLPGLDTTWGSIRGGHAYVLRPETMGDTAAWWEYYNQGREGACVGYAWSRCMTLLNRNRYDAHWLYKRAQETDDWPGEDYEGTSVRAGGNVLRTEGHKKDEWEEPRQAAGVSAYRWAQSVDEVRAVIASPKYDELGGIPLLNSWGRNYPQQTFVPFETLHRLLVEENGEAAVCTDR